MKSQMWIPSTTDFDPDHKLMDAGSDIVGAYRSGPGPLAAAPEQPCPYCHFKYLRFYYHEFDIAGKSWRRGTLWVWCPNCLYWTHISHLRLPPWVHYHRTISDDTLSNLQKRHRLLDTLNQLWEENQIPHGWDVRVPGAEEKRNWKW